MSCSTEQCRVLILRAAIPVGVQNELRIRQVLLEDEGITRIDDHVVAAVHHERRLRDLLSGKHRIFRRSAPFLQCRYLGRATLSVARGSRSSLRARCRSRNFLPAAWLRADGVKDTKPQLVRRIVKGSEDLLRLGCERRHLLATLGPVPTEMSFL